MYYIDSHSHLFLEEFNEDRKEVIERANRQGVQKMLLPNVDLSTLQNLLDACNLAPGYLFPAIGLHPCSVKVDYAVELTGLYNQLKKNKYYAIGEIGIDLYWDRTYINEQCIALEKQISWALELNLPVILHCRESFEEVIEVVSAYKNLRGVFHAFTGNAMQAHKAIDMGFYLGIGGIVTFKNSGLDKVVTKIPLEKIVLETDSPYLAPVPFRGKRNEPTYIKHIAEKLSVIYNKSLSEVANITTTNAENLFKF
jgi:TatD DNase family protein